MKILIVVLVMILIVVIGNWVIQGKTLSIWPPSFGYGRCGRCDRPWNIAEHHSTMITENWGVFPLCEPCWEELTPKTRLPYYKELFYRWPLGKNYTWEDVEKAVAEEQ